MEENMKQMISKTPANCVRSALEARFLRSISVLQEGAVDPASLDSDQIGQNWKDSNNCEAGERVEQLTSQQL